MSVVDRDRHSETEGARQRILAALSRRAVGADDPQTLMDEAVVGTARSLGSEYAAVFELLPAGRKMCLRAGVGWKAGSFGHHTVGAGSKSLGGYTLRSDAPLVANDLRAEARFKVPPLLAEHRVTSGITVNIQGHGRPFGVLGIFAARRRSFSADDADFLQTVANVLATAIARKDAEEAHRRLHRERDEILARLHLQFEHMPIACITSDSQFRIIDCNPAGEALFGYRREELLGMDVQLLVAPASRAYTQGIIRRLAAGDMTAHAVNENVTKDGRIILCQWSNTPLRNADGQVTAILSMAQDITEGKRAEQALRASEERVRLLLESTAEAIYGLDVEGNCIFSNPACLRLLGYRDPGDLLGKPMDRLIHHTRRDGTPYAKEECPILAAFQRGEEVHTDDEVLWRADGSSFPAEYWSHPVRREGQIVGAVVTFLDITERKRLEKEILEISERERRRIGQDLHDDLCQQLTGIAFTGRLLQQRLAASCASEAGVAEKMVHAVQHATARARDLAKGLHPVSLEAHGLTAALRELSTTLKSMFQISCRFQSGAGRQTLRRTDPVVAIQLYRIAQEAATNAVKHGKAKDICIRIGVVKGRIELIISDDGVGMTGAPHRLGMGIPVMYQRARMIGAALTISPRRQGGTLVTCSLGGQVLGTIAEVTKPRSRRRADRGSNWAGWSASRKTGEGHPRPGSRAPRSS